MLRAMKNRHKTEEETRGLCVLTLFHFHGTKESSGNAVSQLASDVIVPAEKPFLSQRAHLDLQLDSSNRS